MAAFTRARPCCSSLRANLCCPAWQLLLWLRFVNLNKDTIIIIIISHVKLSFVRGETIQALLGMGGANA